MLTGYIYFILDKKDNAVKIGYSENPQRRLVEIQATRKNKLKLFYTQIGNKRDEQIYHMTYSQQRLGGEWFRVKGKLKEFIAKKLSTPHKDMAGFEKQEFDNTFMLMGDGDYRILFGKHYNGTLRNLIKYERGYVDWLIWKSDFPEHIKEFVADFIWHFEND